MKELASFFNIFISLIFSGTLIIDTLHVGSLRFLHGKNNCRDTMNNNVYMSEIMNRHDDDDATRTSTSEGLEEGEVEGETLLIVESEDQASVDLSHDQSGDSVNSDEGDASWTEEMSFYCERCQKWIPASKTTFYFLSCFIFGLSFVFVF